MKKDYELLKKRDDSIVVKQYGNLVEISCQIDTEKVKFKRDFRSNKIEYHGRLIMNLDDTLARWVSWEKYISPIAFKAAIRELRDGMKAIRELLEKGKEYELFPSMDEIALDYLEYYKTDFYYHDVLKLARDNPEKFLWIIRPSGTWLFDFNYEFAREALKYTLRESGNRLFIGMAFPNNPQLIEVSYSEAESFLHSLPEWKG